ncbi:sigma-54-dependent Fis family transcriptional regulator [Chloracidobacterium sp. MS 40/45]|uniref:sigma-54-dependent transcriptional regulator n=1 Tax=Chloracidobacterium aggregatum TaxID=2851959 RepID=UPI001B8C59D9|nr:sigma-54 dependent transcriptional regulator [Chloracidobacterium aggregatum]QUV98919.1 sigma-54-dependent Fis family transcriptional regulator [Chloracidobacterium sp. MS 40/45]
MAETVLIVDDERGIRESLRGVLEDEGFVVEKAESGDAALRRLATTAVNCILLDIYMPNSQLDGMATLEHIRRQYPHIPVVMISGHGTIDTAVRAIRLGASDFIEKPLNIERTLQAVRHAIQMHRPAPAPDGSDLVVGQSVPMRALRQQIALTGPTDGRVLIYGESGTGKELVALALHAASKRTDQPFVAVNCAAVPEDLIESELFGHVKGAFTGATESRRGKFEQADGGTLFLDEVGDMSLRMQAKLLRALESGLIEPVGSQGARRVDVRVIAATNKRLDEAIEQGQFRADLFYRLNVIPFQLPPLREHLEDIPALVEHFVRQFSQHYQRPPITLTEDACEKLRRHEWPGNVRELRNLIERLVITETTSPVTAEQIPLEPAPNSVWASFQFGSLREGSEAFERELVRRKLAECDGNVTQAAEALGIDRSYLYRRIKALGISLRG